MWRLKKITKIHGLFNVAVVNDLSLHFKSANMLVIKNEKFIKILKQPFKIYIQINMTMHKS